MTKGTDPHIVTMPTDEEARAAFDAYALAAGKVGFAWNYLHETLVLVFASVVGEGNLSRSLAVAVWYSSDSDRTQQNMLKAAIEASPIDRWPERPKARDDLLWLLAEARALADHRNNAIHTPAILFIGGGPNGEAEMGPAFIRGHPRARRLIGKRLLEEFAWYEDWAETISRFAGRVELALTSAERPWPDRPRRPSRGPKSNHQDPLRPPGAISRPRQRRS
jgi:hypothetical protein